MEFVCLFALVFLFCTILNARLINFSEENKIIHPTQLGFISESRTADHILTLKTLHGKFRLTQQQLSEKASHALHKIRKHIDISLLSPMTAIKIFRGVISPILLYNSEVWGAYKKKTTTNGTTQKQKKIS